MSREMPNAVSLEQSVLGSLMVYPKVIQDCQELDLHAEEFYLPSHQQIYQAICTIHENGQPIDMNTVVNRLQETDQLESSQGADYIIRLADSAISSATSRSYIETIKNKAQLRRLIYVADKISEEGYSSGEDIDTVLDDAERLIMDVTRHRRGSEFESSEEIVTRVINELKELRTMKGITGIETGYVLLDRMTNGFQRGDLIILAARPAMGKTAFVLSMAKNIAVNFRNPVALFSLEMSNVQLVNRLISNVCEIPSEKIKSGQLADYEWQQLDYKLRDLLDAPLYVDDTPSLSVFELRTKARRLVREHGVKVIIIDYLQLMNASGMSFGSRQEEVSTISRSLKGLAKELNIPIIALSQLNRGVENREGEEGKRPQLSDLRESGAIEQDADMVCFIHRPEYYKIYTSADGTDLRGMAEIIIAKHRNGAVGDVRLRFIGQYTRFQNPEDDMVIPPPTEGMGGATFGSRMNAPIGSPSTPPPPSASDYMPQTDNPFGGVGLDGPVPF